METETMETVSAIALNRIFGFEPSLARRLMENLGSARAVFALSQEEKDSIFGPYSKYKGAISQASLDAASEEWERIRGLGCSFVHCGQDCYPQLLLECADPPVGLYLRSSTAPQELFRAARSIAVVGTRDMSPYGREMTERAVQAMSYAEIKPLIVSGLAIGVDITAHMAALSCGLPTVAVLPVGIDSIYPRRHRIAAEKIIETPGCAVVTDYPPGTAPTAFNFLRRNRIIAGLADATLLVESKTKGGGTMTARLAASYGRELFCVPGRLEDLRSGGCNLLIQEKLAECVASVESLPEALGLGRAALGKTSLDGEIRKLYSGALQAEELDSLVMLAQTIRRNRGITVEELAERTGLGYSRAAAWTSLLESDSFISVDLLQRCAINAKLL